MITKPNAGPPIICGRPYVLFDPEQTAEIKRIEAKNDAIESVVNGLSAAMDAVYEYASVYGSDRDLQSTLSDATRKLAHMVGIEFDEELDAYYSDEDARKIEWRGEVETLC